MIKRLSALRAKNNEDGYLLVAVLTIVVVIATISIPVMHSLTGQYRLATDGLYADNALLTAEAGIEQSVHALNKDDTFGGYTTEQEFFNNEDQGRGVYTTTITNATNDNSKTILSIGKTFRNNKMMSQKIIKVTVVGTGSEGYSVLSGPGGLMLGGSASITNSEIYVNGTLALSGSAKIGTPDNPVNVNVANIACPSGTNPGPTYPTLCTDGSQPISLAWSTMIYGSVCATGQTSKGPNNNIQPGNGGQGLILGCTAPTVSPITYDRNAQIAAVSTTSTGNDNKYVCKNWPFARTWPANLKLTGNVSISSSCDLTIKGNAYITGDLTIGGAAKITVDESVGNTRPVVIVDGTITVGGSASMIANSYGTGIEFISFKSSAACSPNCSSVTGTDLKKSQSLLTVDVGGAVNLPGMVFNAYWSKIRLAGSGSVGAVAGQTIDLSGAGTVVFGTTLSSGARTWTISSYQQLYHL